MIELTEWFANASLPARPWLVLGKGPTFDRRDRFDLDRLQPARRSTTSSARSTVDVAHIIDVDVVGACAEGLRDRTAGGCSCPATRTCSSDRCATGRWRTGSASTRCCEELDRARAASSGTTSPATRSDGRSPVIGAKRFSAEAALNILGLMGVHQVRSLGIDGGRAYSAPFQHLSRRDDAGQRGELIRPAVRAAGRDRRPSTGSTTSRWWSRCGSSSAPTSPRWWPTGCSSTRSASRPASRSR